MKAEIISIGSELLCGLVVNTNANFICSELEKFGIECITETTVRDDETEIHNILSIALERADLIITTGGLGPTKDDLTHEALASFFKAKLKLDKKVLNELQKKFYLRGYKKMPLINAKQAFKPIGSKWIPNISGTANGVMWEVDIKNKKSLIITFPGVPKEMKEMWGKSITPFLFKEMKKQKEFIYSKILQFTGIGESALAEKIKPVFDLKNPVIATYCTSGEIKVRITSKANTLNKAKELVAKVVKKILNKCEKYYFGENVQTLEEIVANLATSKGVTISCAESCTGGLLSKRLTDISGSSAYIKLNVVTYSNESKEQILDIPKDFINKYGAVSSQTAKLMATNVKDLTKTDIGLSITGIAGPKGGSKEKPVGLVYFGIAHKNKTKVKKILFGQNLSREQVRWLSTQFILNWLRKELINI